MQTDGPNWEAFSRTTSIHELTVQVLTIANITIFLTAKQSEHALRLGADLPIVDLVFLVSIFKTRILLRMMLQMMLNLLQVLGA